MPGGAVVVICTRWHEDDLAGRLLEQEGDQWEVLSLPALHPERGALWPEWYDETALLRIKETIGPREWSALYQQQPQPDEGTFFQRDWFKSWETLPTCRYYITSDFAVTDGGGDYTVLTVWGISGNGDIYRVEQWKGQTASDVWIERMLDLVARWKPLCCFGESGVIAKSLEPILRRRMRERGVHCRLEWIPSIADKPTRARSFQAMAAQGRVHFERGADLSEFLVFPAGRHDDEVDSAGMIGRAIDQAHPAMIAERKVEKRRDRWDREEDTSDTNWKVL
jgi:predicted phage terminase large subunit-like protein